MVLPHVDQVHVAVSVEVTSHMIWHSHADAHGLHVEHLIDSYLDFLYSSVDTFHVVHHFLHHLLPILHFTPYSGAHPLCI